MSAESRSQQSFPKPKTTRSSQIIALRRAALGLLESLQSGSIRHRNALVLQLALALRSFAKSLVLQSSMGTIAHM